MLPFPAAAAPKSQAAHVTVMDQDWQKTFALMKNKQDPVAARLLLWIYATETDIPVEAAELIRFVNENPGWPRLHEFRSGIEKSISSSRLRPHEIADWFRQNPPGGYEGMKAFMNALALLGQEEEARQALARFWTDAGLDTDEAAAMAQVYRAYLSPADHAARLDNLIWQGRYAEAKDMLPFVDAAARKTGEARIALARQSMKAGLLLLEIPAALKNDQGLLFERARWHRRRNDDGAALGIIDGIREPLQHPEIWWAEQNILARRAMEDRDFAKAHAIISRHQLKDGIEYAQAEWTLGWLELRFLHRPQEAGKRFAALYGRVQSAISKSRTAYWAARAAETLGQADTARQWDAEAAQFLSTYYGQLSLQKLHGTPDASRHDDVPPAAARAFEQRDLVRAVRILENAGLDRLVDPFLAKLVAAAKDRADYQMAAHLAHETGHEYYAVQANKDLQQKLGGFLPGDGYPVLASAPLQPEKALVHAIVYRESMFNTNAVSAAGAQGLMQLMPATAKAVSKRRNKKFTKQKLTEDPAYNVLLGSSYLAGLIDDYGGNYPLAIAAYNAGPGNVADWVRAFGNPATGQVDPADWIELISNHETRNYVQRVMETYYMYRLKFHEKPKTVEDFK